MYKIYKNLTLQDKFENYKDLLKRKKEERERHEQLRKENRELELKLAVSSSSLSNPVNNWSKENKKARINKAKVGQIKGHIGSFSDGILKLKKFDLKKLNASNKNLK